jgi:eukaryotic-like serine/threonine-protein kinase
VVGEVIAGRYELEELCGAGGMSSVYRAHDRLLERKVAIKILHERHGEDAEFVERFRREARAVAQLSHPNIVTVIDRGSEGDRQFIVFEYVDGENLKELVRRKGVLPIADVVGIGIEIARALAFAHERGLVHRDVKPQNVLLNGDGQAKVTDFGIARSLDVEKGVTQTGTVLGTSTYIAPEQASGEKVDERSDVYSLGVVLFELLTGEVPFSGESFVAVAMKHVSEPPPPVLERRPDTPARLAFAVDRALAKDPADRPEMDELVEELSLVRQELEGAAPGEETMEKLLPRRQRRHVRPYAWPLVLGLLGVALIAAALGAALLLGDRNGNGSGGAIASPPAPPEEITISAVASSDPFGDDRAEHDSEVGRAADGDARTAWRTSRYRYPGGGLGKPGVGIVLRVSGSPRTVVVTSDTPGFQAELRSGDEVVSQSRTVGSTTAFPIEEDIAEGELVLWITNLGPNASVQVNEVTAR